MSTTDDTAATGTTDANALDPAMLDEVEQALNAARTGAVQTDDGGIPIGEDPTQGGGVARPNGGIPHAETTPGATAGLGGGVARPNGGIPHAETTGLEATADDPDGGIPHAEDPTQGGGVAHPNGGIPHAETTRS